MGSQAERAPPGTRALSGWPGRSSGPAPRRWAGGGSSRRRKPQPRPAPPQCAAAAGVEGGRRRTVRMSAGLGVAPGGLAWWAHRAGHPCFACGRAPRPSQPAALSPPHRSQPTWLYLARRSERQGAPVLIWPVHRPTARSAMKLSSVSPDLQGGAGRGGGGVAFWGQRGSIRGWMDLRTAPFPRPAGGRGGAGRLGRGATHGGMGGPRGEPVRAGAAAAAAPAPAAQPSCLTGGWSSRPSRHPWTSSRPGSTRSGSRSG